MKFVYIIHPEGKPKQAQVYATLKRWCTVAGINYNSLNVYKTVMGHSKGEFTFDYEGFVIMHKEVIR